MPLDPVIDLAIRARGGAR